MMREMLLYLLLSASCLTTQAEEFRLLDEHSGVIFGPFAYSNRTSIGVSARAAPAPEKSQGQAMRHLLYWMDTLRSGRNKAGAEFVRIPDSLKAGIVTNSAPEPQIDE